MTRTDKSVVSYLNDSGELALLSREFVDHFVRSNGYQIVDVAFATENTTVGCVDVEFPIRAAAAYPVNVE